MGDMASTIIPKSDQLNADDLIAGDMTITITRVEIRPGQEQSVSIFFDGDNGKPYKTCKSMNRVIVMAWGADSKKYVGRTMTLYREPTVKWAGMEVGGIRISHMSDIDSKLIIALTMSKSNRKPYTVKPLEKASGSATKSAAAQEVGSPQTEGTENSSPASAADPITANEALKLESRCTENNIPPEKVKKFFKVMLFSQMDNATLAKAHAMIDSTLSERAATK